jgi:hypothetical protein
LINNQALCLRQEVKVRVHNWIRSILAIHLPQGHNFEVAWSLVAAGVLRIRLEEADVPKDTAFPGAIVLAMFGLLRERNLTSFPLARWDWRGLLRTQGSLGENWLLLYEGVRRNWTKDRKIVNHANSHSLLAQALRENVAFLRDDVFDAQRINLDRRTFRPKPPSSQADTVKDKSEQKLVTTLGSSKGLRSIGKPYEGDGAVEESDNENDSEIMDY